MCVSFLLFFLSICNLLHSPTGNVNGIYNHRSGMSMSYASELSGTSKCSSFSSIN